MRLLFALASGLILVGCSAGKGDNASPVKSHKKQMSEGSLVIARALPSKQSSTSSLFGFMPQSATMTDGHRLVIDRKAGVATVLQGARKLSSYPLNDIDGLEVGSYEVLHKQRRPVWYATNKYFENRSLPVPSKNDSSRYLKGALGDFVIFLDNKTPIHNSAVFAEEVGGVRMADNAIAQIYYQLEVGASIVVE